MSFVDHPREETAAVAGEKLAEGAVEAHPGFRLTYGRNSNRCSVVTHSQLLLPKGYLPK
jgi:hypothetical protein